MKRATAALGRIAAEPRHRDETRRGARPRSTAIAGSPRRSAPRRRRWRARRNWPTAACRRSWPSATNGRRRKAGAASQIATIEARVTEVTDRARRARQRAGGLRGKAQRADQRDRARRRRPPRRRRRAGRGRERDGGNRPRRQDLARSAVERPRSHRPRRGAHGRRQAPPRRHRARNPRHARSRAARRSRRSPRSSRAPSCRRSPRSRQNLEKLRRDRERLGAVNLRAEEELREVETQHTSLTTERDDLVEAIKRLRQGIQSLNREARERLLTSFEVVNGHFKRLFTELFGGGEAALHLIESDDPLEAGLEIIAKPPGKKPQTLSLLSGGEQALTALALIFAVFLTNPSPICVLDEVDAPLDDHNVERFCNLLTR